MFGKGCDRRLSDATGTDTVCGVPNNDAAADWESAATESGVWACNCETRAS